MDSTIFIIGSGTIAQQLTQSLLAEGFRVVLATTKENALSDRFDERFEHLPAATLTACHGTVGDYTITADLDGATVLKRASCIVIAEDYAIRPNFSCFGLMPAEQVMSASTFSQEFYNNPSANSFFSQHRKIVFLSGLAIDSYPFALKDIMQQCLTLQTEFHCRTYVLTRNLKVADTGLEALYHETKKAGTVFVKLSDTSPLISQLKDGRVEIKYMDESVRQQFLLKPDLTVVDESIYPSESLASLAALFRLEMDANGFIQAENVHRDGVYTNRKGIMAVGPARGINSTAEHSTDITLALISSMHLKGRTLPALVKNAEIDPAKCIRCLTCYRICPYRAVDPHSRPAIHPAACEGCGICMVECPMAAILVETHKTTDLSAIDNAKPFAPGSEFTPRLAVFCCSRSASEAYRQAKYMGYSMPENLTLIELPCAGSLSLDHIYHSFNKEIDAVAIYTCHPGNCHAEIGNLMARGKADQAAEFFEKAGFEPERIRVESLAANMGSRFAQSITAFAESILKLGPSRLKR